MSVHRAHRQASGSQDQRGQTLVEFALVIPMLLLLVMAVFEFAVAFNVYTGLNRASQNAAHLASTLADTPRADCRILKEIDEDLLPPINKKQVLQVAIQRTSLSGNNALQDRVYTRTETPRTCQLPSSDESVTVYYSLPAFTKASEYSEEQRCPALSGCVDDLGATRTTVDNIGVAVTYRHDWLTPLSGIITSIPGGVNKWTFTQRNIFRMEPSS